MNDLLDTEHYVEQKATECVKGILNKLGELTEDMERLTDADWSSILLDAGKRSMLMQLLPTLESLNRNLGEARLVTLVASLLVKPKQEG